MEMVLVILKEGKNETSCIYFIFNPLYIDTQTHTQVYICVRSLWTQGAYIWSATYGYN